MKPARDERGQTTILIVGFCTLIVLLAVVVVNASAAFLQRQRLADLADGAAIAAADQVSLGRLYAAGPSSNAPLDSASARQAVADYLRASSETDRLQWNAVASRDAVTVRFARQISLPLVPPGWFRSARVTAEATSLLRIHD